ncbi:MAG: hypothetical protein G01um10148_1047 [Parcubacteria group bacterium Gr01-1014_8]|nr:MAG: hypothetical protein G01um10148_1047 [Parcubacteria group bacterium Gr01-1014_8]
MSKHHKSTSIFLSRSTGKKKVSLWSFITILVMAGAHFPIGILA